MSKFSHINPATYYTAVLPSTREQVTYRAYSVKEEKQLLLAEQSDDGITMLKTLTSIIEACVKPKQKHLTQFDAEYMFSQIRAKSVGEFSNIKVGCDEVGCEKVQMDYKYQLSDIKVQYPDNDASIIKISDSLAFKLRYPDIDEAIALEVMTDEVQKKFKAITSSIVEVYNEDEVLTVGESMEDKQGIIDLIDKLKPDQYELLAKFFDTMPYIYGTISYKCPNCRKEHSLTIKGLTSFFA